MKTQNKILIGIAVVIVLALAWWLASPLFINKTVNEELPGTNKNPESPDENIKVQLEGTFTDADSFHKTSGTAKIVEIDGKKYLSLENFETTNGPDLYVYLSTDKESNDFVNLGKLKGNKGNQNYEIPEGTDLENYDNAVIWCRAFSVLFGSAELS